MCEHNPPTSYTMQKPHTILWNFNLSDKVFINSEVNQGLLNNKSILKYPQSHATECFSAAYRIWCNIVTTVNSSLLKAVCAGTQSVQAMQK